MMDYVKKLGLAVLGLAAVTALLSAASASATVLCKNESAPCSATYGVGTEISVALNTGTAWVLKAGFATVECSEASYADEVEEAGGPVSTVKGKRKRWSLGRCNCEVKVLATGKTEWHWIANTRNATLTSTGKSVTANCFGVDCVYGDGASSNHEGTFTGLVTPILHESRPFGKESGSALCANPATETAEYSVSSPTPIYVAES